MFLEGRDDVGVHQVDGGDRQLAWVEPGPGIAAVAVDCGLQIDLAHAFERADEEGRRRGGFPYAGPRCGARADSPSSRTVAIAAQADPIETPRNRQGDRLCARIDGDNPGDGAGSSDPALVQALVRACLA